jgi:hypothetical protein
MRRLLPLVSAVALLVPVRNAAAEIVWENPRLRVVLGEDAAWRSVADKQSGKEYCAAEKRVRLAAVQVGGKHCEAASASLQDKRLVVGFSGCDTKLVYEVSAADDWMAFRLVEVAGARPSHVTLLHLGVTIADRVGPRLAAAWNDQFAICIRAMNMQTDGRAARRAGLAELAATTQDAPGPKLEGAAAAILAGPPAELRQQLRRLAAACNLPQNEADGVPSKNLPIARGSYWFLSFGEKDAGRVIDYCRRTGIRQVMLNSGSWCQSPGHYTFNKALYPDGQESLRRMVARLHQEGILVGMHCFASKVSKADAYVTPVPDRRFWVDMSGVLAADAGPADAAIRTSSDLSQWPGSPVARQKLWEGGVEKHREVILDDEIIRYQSIGPEGKWDTFLGCQRGAWKTKAVPHKAGAAARHYGVDGCINGYIVDQETTLLDETTTRLAGIFNACQFDMVYFDGGEDVDKTRFNYYVSKFQAVAMGKFRKRPIVHMGTIMTHDLWHLFTRSGTVDTYLNTLYGHVIAGGKIETWPTVRSHIDGSVRYVQSVGEDMMPGELGWFGIWPKGKNTDGLQLDEIEYLMVKSLAYNAPISLQTSFAQMESHPLLPGILEIVGGYESLRREEKVPQAALARLQQLGKDYCCCRLPVAGSSGGDAAPELIEVTPLSQVAGGRDLRGMIGAHGQGTVATLWHYLGQEGILVVAAAPIEATDFQGSSVRITDREGVTAILIGARRVTLFFPHTAPQEAARLLAEARLEKR